MMQTFVAEISIKSNLHESSQNKMCWTNTRNVQHEAKRSCHSSVKGENMMQASLSDSLTSHCPAPLLTFQISPPVKWVSKCARQKAALRGCALDSRGSVGQSGRALLHWWACPVRSGCLGSLYRRWCEWKDHMSASGAPGMQTNSHQNKKKKKKNK